MIEITNKAGIVAKIFGDIVEREAVEQIRELADMEPYLKSTIRVMPDVHAGNGCTVGTTITIGDKLIPNHVGYDIGCGMYVIPLGKTNVDLQKVDEIIHAKIPSGMNIHGTPIVTMPEIEQLKCVHSLDIANVNSSLCTLGSGNHFIEINEDYEENLYIVIHSGSRNLGARVCKYYQKRGVKQMEDNGDEIRRIISSLKDEGRQTEIQSAIAAIGVKRVEEGTAFVEGDELSDYLHDMAITQRYATLNRVTIGRVITEGLGLDIDWSKAFHTVHNYIDLENGILRKGAVSAQEGERLIIPMNMRDGSLLCIGKGNPDWNYSAPHGAGRLMSRSQARKEISLAEFKNSMEGIYSTSVCDSTIDEAPQAYKPMDSIVDNLYPTAAIERVIRSIYNYKSKG